MKNKLLYFMLLVVSLSYGQIPTTDLIKSYEFTNGSLVNQTTPGINDLSPTGTARVSTTDFLGTANNALILNGDSFDGGTRDDGSQVVGREDASISFWIKTGTVNSTPQNIIQQTGTSGFGNYGWFTELVNGKIKLTSNFLKNGNQATPIRVIESSTIVADNNWHHVAIVFRRESFSFNGTPAHGLRRTIYIDGVQEATTRDGGASSVNLVYVNSALETVKISEGNNKFIETLDNIRIYNTALSDADIASLYGELPLITYVNQNATGNNDGTSWANAYTSLQDAILASSPANQIWIAQGAYKPSTNSRTASFDIIHDNIKIYGGFSGNETHINQRDINNNVTILSGDINGDDSGVFFTGYNRGDNSYHVAKINGNNILLDGIQINDGHADLNTNENNRGSAIIVNPAVNGFTVKNCKFKSNVSTSGGAIFAYFNATANVVIEKCVFNKNLSVYGSGLYLLTDTNATLNISVSNSLFNNNESTDAGSTLGLSGSAMWIRSIGASSQITATIANCTFANNFDRGSATNSQKGPVALSEQNGNSQITAAINNCIFYHNRISVNPNNTTASTAVNRAHKTLPVTLTVNNSIDENAFSNLTSGTTSILSSNPLFTSTTDYTLQSGSPAIDAGNNTFVIGTTDLAGNQRVFNTTVDMGAYEFGATAPITRALTINATNGTVTTNPNPTNGTYADGTVVALTATPATGYQFDGWSGDVTGNTNPINITMDADKTVTATFSQQCLVSIPDTNFKNYLVGNTAINTNGDTEIQCSEATAFTGTINVSNQNISDLTGIEAFTNITELDCGENQLTSLNVTQNTALTMLRCAGNQLISLDVSQNTALTQLYLQDNQITSLDVSQNTLLQYIYCYNNQLTSLDLSQNTMLISLQVYNNQLTSLDVSQNTALTLLACANNQLTNLNIANSNNANINIFNALNNANLTCIQIDAGFTPPTNWQKDAGASYSTNCNPQRTLTLNAANGTIATNPNPTNGTYANGTVVALTATPATGYQFDGWSGSVTGTTNPINITMDADKTVTATFSQQCLISIPDANFKAALVGNTAINTNGDTEIQCSEATAFTGTINVSNQNITDLTGIEAFTSIQVLEAANNQLTNINITANTQLLALRVGNNSINNINISSNPNLVALEVHNNQLTTIDISSNPNLIHLYLQNNSITSLDISLHSAINYLNVSNNNLTSLNVANGNNTNFYDASNGGGSGNPAMDARGNTSLTCIQHDSNFTPPNSPASSRWEKDTTASWSDNCSPQRTLTINATNGTVTTNPNPTNGTYADGTVVALTATPATGYQFDGWSGDVTGTTNPVNINMDADKTVTAMFSLIPQAPIPTFVNSPANISGAYTATINFSSAVTGFDMSDIQATGASLSNFTAVSGTEYTVLVTPTSICSTTVTLQVPANVAQGSNSINNVASAVTTINAVDNFGPTIVAQGFTLQLDANGQATLTVANIDNGSTDNCVIATRTLNKTSFTCTDIGVNTVTLTVTDASNNRSDATVTVTVVDSIVPIVAVQNITVQLGTNGQANITTADINNGSSDNCAISSMSLDKTNFTCNDLGANTVILTIEDTSGNQNTATATVTVTQNPNAQLAAVTQNITVQLDANGSATITPAQVDNGSGSGCNSNPTLSLDKTTFDCSNIGTNTVTLTATDSGTSATATATVTVEDKMAPTIVAQDFTLQLDANGQGTLTVANIDNGSTDNCAIATRTLNKTSFTCTDIGANTVTLTVTDASNNRSDATVTVTVIDSIVPIVAVQNITVQLGTNGQANITTADINNGSYDNCAISSMSLDKTNFTCNDLGANTVTLTVEDTSGNQNTATATVTVTQNPNAQLAAVTQNITVQLDANGSATITPAQVDNGSGSGCNSNPTLSLDKITFDCSNIGTNTVTLTATDSGTSATATATVTVEDKMAPTIVAQDFTLQLDANGQGTLTVANIDNRSTDNCAIAIRTLDKTSFTCSELGANTVTLTIVDNSGNTANATATVTVVETVAPTVITQNITTALDANGNLNITPQQIDNGSSDACSGIAAMSLDKTSFSCPNLGDITVTLTVTDNSGNSATKTAVVTITGLDEDNDGISDACDSKEIVLSKGFSPNGDGVNDTWVIENINNYPNSKIEIFNRWGEKMYQVNNYQNDWDAKSNQRGGSNEKLPVGSYLYIINLNEPGFGTIQGWLYINY
ncbi:gliding motility-associated C-terminal domain-containing protein [uncultured Tenacibaculum sp.]|uniref:InlB B-repeat-containing protein n=1 Tax=uncultured Tenacibaculum sp. TaxID=174713 RepID=UPI0026361BF7|nr:gliding motility-associated C-terminal domain-containing protein [uncultured Tenacibaculum sp.]